MVGTQTISTNNKTGVIRMHNEVPQSLQNANPDIKIYHITDKSFLSYGRVHQSLNVEGYLDYLDKNIQVTGEIFYSADYLGTDFNSSELKPIINTVYGGLADIQVGICHGKNKQLNALEYHKGTETIIPGTDMVILLGLTDDIDWVAATYETSRVKAFFVPRGTVYELSGRCLHYAPIHVDEQKGFSLVVLLPRGTNEALDFLPVKKDENRLLFGKNKWFIAHSEDESSVKMGAHIGLIGHNTELKIQ
jgi:hypothetical protein